MLIIPGQCWLCRMPLACPHWGICSCCTASLLASPPPCCPRCGLPALHQHLPCGRCLQRPPPWEAIVFVTDYSDPLKTLVHRLKFNGVTALAQGLARLLLLVIKNRRCNHLLPFPDIVFSVPLHSHRAWTRGFNQSALIAAALAHWLPCQYLPSAIRRVRPTRVQHHLTATARRKNVKNAFRINFPVAGCHIALVDDVITTGSTLSEIARQLKKQGALTIQVWCLCRTL